MVVVFSSIKGGLAKTNISLPIDCLVGTNVKKKGFFINWDLNNSLSYYFPEKKTVKKTKFGGCSNG